MKASTLIKLSVLSTSLLVASASFAAQHVEMGAGWGFGTLDTSSPITDGNYLEDGYTITITGPHHRDNDSSSHFYIADWSDTSVARLQLGLEIGYSVLPTSQYNYNSNYNQNTGVYFSTPSKVTYTSHSTDLLLGVRYHFAQNVFGVAQAGLASVQQKVDFTTQLPIEGGSTAVTNIQTSKTDSAIKPEFALGMGYDITKHWSASVFYRTILGSKNQAISSDEDVTNLILGNSALDATPSSSSSYLVNLTYVF